MAKENDAGRTDGSFVYGKLLKLAELQPDPPAFMHYRARDGEEVYFVLEAGGNVVAIKVNASVGVRAGDFRSLATMRGAGETIPRRGPAAWNAFNAHRLHCL